MSILPTWPIAIAALVVGLAAGAYADHTVMTGRIDKMKADAAEVDRQRAEIRAADERDARTKEQAWTAKVGQIEQEKTDALNSASKRYAAQLDSLRQRPDRRPAASGAMSSAAPACAGATGAELSRPDAGFLAGYADRAEHQRIALAACYKAYDEISTATPIAQPPAP